MILKIRLYTYEWLTKLICAIGLTTAASAPRSVKVGYLCHAILHGNIITFVPFSFDKVSVAMVGCVALKE